MPSSSSAYNLRRSPPRSEKGQRLSSYIRKTKQRGALSSPTTKRRIYKEADEAIKRDTGKYFHGSVDLDCVLLANEIVSGGRPPDWHIARHQRDLWRDWERAMGKRWGAFESEMEEVPWEGSGTKVKAPRMKGVWGQIDMGTSGLLQGRSAAAKRLDGKPVDCHVRPAADEMNWREWRKFSRACNLLLEAVDGVPWGWEMDDEEWEKFSKAYDSDECGEDLTECRDLINWAAARDDFDRWEREGSRLG